MPSKLVLPSLPVWEPKWGQEALKHAEMTNPRAFSRGFRMQAFSDDELMFPSFKTCYEPGLVLGEVQRRGLPAFVGVDLAGDKRPGNAIVTLGLDLVTRRRYVLEVLFGAWKSPETAGHISAVCSRHNVRYIMVENNAYQQSLIDWVKHSCKDYSFWTKIEAFTTGKNKVDQTYGLPSLEVEFKNLAWSIPSGEFAGHPPACLCNWCTWMREFTTYPRGATWDGVMATWFAREALDRWGGTGSAATGLGAGFNDR